jgi:autoinducer 2 (AI-2) kinase
MTGAQFDLDLTALFSGLAGATREALARAGARPEQVLGIAATSMRYALVMVDAHGQPVFATPNRDARAAAEAYELRTHHGQEIYARTGLWPTPISPLARLLWLARHDAETWETSEHLLALSDWINLRLTGEIAAEPSQSGATLLFDLKTRDWSWDWMGEPQLPHHLLPSVAAPGSRLGALQEDAAEALGLRPGTPVAIGGGDTQCGLLGAGVLTAGELGVVAGTTAPVCLALDRPIVDPQGLLWTGHHLADETWLLESNAGGMGETLDWVARLLAPDVPEPVARLLAEAAGSDPGAGGMLSTLGAHVPTGPDLQLPYGSLSLSHLCGSDPQRSRAQVAQAVLEGMAFALRAHAERLSPYADVPPTCLHMAGGMTRSALWPELAANVLDMPVAVAGTPETSAFGAALCAGVAAGLWDDLAGAAAHAAQGMHVLEPDPARARSYADLYADWCQVSEARLGSDEVARNLALPRVLQAALQDSETGPLLAQPRILVTADMDEAGLESLRALGEVEHASFRERMRLLTGPSLVKALGSAGIFVTEVDVVDADVLARLPDLRVIVSCRGEAVNVDLEACSAYGIPVLNAPGRNADAVADLALAFLLMLARKLPRATGFLREPGGQAGDMGRMGQAFGLLQGRELGARSVGLVGFGAVGRKVAERLAAFGANVLVHDPYATEDAAALAGVRLVELPELLAESDFVSLHRSVTDATHDLIDASALARMKPGACLVNTARAALVNEDALVDALTAGHLGGAALDVFWEEPPGSDHPLLAMEHVIATPHVGGNTADVAAHQGRIVSEDLERLLRGERPCFVLNPDVLDDFDWTKPRPTPDPELVAALASSAGPAVSDLQRDARPARTKAPKPAGPVPPPTPSAAPREMRDAMQRLLQAFVDGIVSDTALAEFSRDRDVTLHFLLSDLALEFHLHLQAGSVTGALAAPETPAEVQLRMQADVLDGMFTGRVNAMQSAMNGRLSFTGDAGKAMTLQHIQANLSRLYRAARLQAGDPGDLASLPAPGAAGPAGAGSADDPRGELVRVVNELYAQQLITATGGNVSARIPDEDQVWITPSQLFKGDLAPEILVRLDLEGRPLDEGARSPSSERMMHCALYARRRNIQAVVHAHAPHATILANTGLPFVAVSTEAAFFGDIPRIPFIMPGTNELAVAVAEAMGDGWAVLMQNHGLLVAGRSLRRAADMVEIIERSAEIILGCHAVGREPPTLPDDVVKQLRSMGDLVA